jgi:hypothetical protein
MHRSLTTVLSNRYVRMQISRIGTGALLYPTTGRGQDFSMHIFGLLYSTSNINNLQQTIWQETSLLPHLKGSPLADLSDIGSRMARTLADGTTPGQLATNELRKTAAATPTDAHFVETMDLSQHFQREVDPVKKVELDQRISNVAFWSQWLTRGVLFEEKLHWELFCEEAVRAPLSKIACVANAALGRHQVEFVYDDYTPTAAQFPMNIDLDKDVDYDSPEFIIEAVAQIYTPVGFKPMHGDTPEHNFRYIHSLMELQMKRAMRGGESILAGDPKG